MEISLAVQLQGFVLAIAVGAALALVYDALKIVRTMMRSTPSHVFWMDMAFMTAAGIVTFLLALAASFGEVRFYLLAGEAMGFCLYFMTFGLISSRVFLLLRRVLDFCVFHPLQRAAGAVGRWTCKRAKSVSAKLKKTRAKRKKRLKPSGEIVYNDSVKSKGKRKKRQKKAARRAKPAR